MRTVRRIAFCLASSGLLAFAVFDLMVLPVGAPRWLDTVINAFNLPVSAVSLLLPCGQRGLDLPLGDCQHQGPEMLWKHLRLAVPVYFGVLYGFGAVLDRVGHGRSKGTRERSATIG